MRSPLLATLFVAVLASATEAQLRLGPADNADGPATDIDRVKVGQPAPDFTLARYGGDPVTLSDFREKKNIVLVFYRGYWCSFCIA